MSPNKFNFIISYFYSFLQQSPSGEISVADMAFTNSNITKFAETQLPRREENNSNNRKYIQGGRRTLTSPAATFLLSFTIFKARIHLRLSESRFKILPPFFLRVQRRHLVYKRQLIFSGLCILLAI